MLMIHRECGRAKEKINLGDMMMEIYDFTCNPHMTWLNINKQCNFRCKWCYTEAGGFSPKDTMSRELAKELIDISKNAGVEHVNFIGGEPTMWDPLFDMTDYCRSIGLTSGLITNAALFGDNRYWAEYQKHPNDRISISIKSMRAEEFKNVTGSTIFNQTVLGIKRAIEFFNTGVTTVYNSLVGLDGLKAIAEETRKLGAKSIIVNMCSPVIGEDGANASFTIPPEQLATDTLTMCDFLNDIYDGEYEVDVQMPLCLFPQDFIDEMLKKNKIQTICQMFSRGGLNFNHKGDVIPCNELFDTIVARYGKDFVDAKSLLSFLNQEEMKDFYSQLLRYPSDECKLCRRQMDCRGGCLLNWFVFEPSICKHVE